MKSIHRRNFIKSAFTGIASTAFLTRLEAKDSIELNSALRAEDNNSEEYWEMVKLQFTLLAGLHYFNNGSLGPSPASVQSATNNYRKILDEFPSKYMWGDWNDEKEAVRKQAAELFSVSAEEIAIIHNTTEGMNMIARSFDLKPGDEIILADHEHSSGTIPWEVWQESKGVKLVRPVLPILPESEEEIVEIYRKAITPRTKIISMCHIVNTNGMILPIKGVSKMAHARGILVAADGAQAAGMVTTNLRDLDCDFYAASSHKWLFSPKGVGVFYAKQESQHYLRPLIVANGYKDKSIRRLENYNTRNLPEVLGLGSALSFHKLIGSEKIHSRGLALKSYFKSQLEGNSNFKFKSPAPDQLSAAIQTVELVGKDVNKVKEELFDLYRIDTRPMSTFGLNGLRISFAIYNTKDDVDYLVNSLKKVSLKN